MWERGSRCKDSTSLLAGLVPMQLPFPFNAGLPPRIAGCYASGLDGDNTVPYYKGASYGTKHPGTILLTRRTLTAAMMRGQPGRCWRGAGPGESWPVLNSRGSGLLESVSLAAALSSLPLWKGHCTHGAGVRRPLSLLGFGDCRRGNPLLLAASSK